MAALSQHQVDEAARLVARFDTIIGDMQRSCARALTECDTAMARLQNRPTVKCDRCRVEVDPSKISMPNRCMDRCCPFTPKDQ
jgi:hypothetical protein